MDSTYFILALGISFICGLSETDGAKWSYEGHAGPKYWHELFPTACSGSYQSPIDLRPEETVYNPDLKDFAIWYDPPKPGSKFYIKNNGHALQVDLDGEFYVTNGGLQHVYKAAQFHYHWGHHNHHGSEHTIDGVASPIEMHLVTWNQDRYTTIGEAVTERDGLAVLGVMFEISKENNPVLDYVIKAIKHVRNPEKKQRIELPRLSIRDLLPEDITKYYRYNGSLTTPNCFESVTWTVFENKQTISHEQLEEFRTLLQFRHKHRKDNDEANTEHERHRRSLTGEERKMERRAQEVLEEAGIKGEHFQETLLRAKLMEMGNMDRMMGDMPVASEPEVKTDENNANHEKEMGHEVKTDETETKVEVETEVLDYEYRQEILVNNFRPVQPLNTRTVQRSFKLRETAVVAESRSMTGGEYTVHTGRSQDDDCDGTSNVVASLCVVILASVVASLFH